MLIDKDWSKILSRIKNREFNEFLDWFYRMYFSRRDHQGVDVMEQDWDYLIILDACRYDMFEEVNWLEGDLSKVISKGSTSIEFLNKNFTGYYEDTVYVSANPFVSPYPSSAHFQNKPFNSEDHFSYVNQVYLKDKYDINGVSSPEGVTKEALKTKSNFPDSRMIVHYMQPHGPFIENHPILEEHNLQNTGYKEMRAAGLSWKEIREVYKANIKRVLKEVEKLIKRLEGKIVVTADHGEMLGERFIFSHPHGVYFDELVEVPWFVIDKQKSGSNLDSIDF